MDAANNKLIIGTTTSGSEELAKKVPRAHVVAAFQTVPSEVLLGVFEARRKTTRPSLVYCGDDEGARETAASLIRDARPCGWPGVSQQETHVRDCVRMLSRLNNCYKPPPTCFPVRKEFPEIDPELRGRCMLRLQILCKMFRLHAVSFWQTPCLCWVSGQFANFH
jgi:hypothetical protein